MNTKYIVIGCFAGTLVACVASVAITLLLGLCRIKNPTLSFLIGMLLGIIGGFVGAGWGMSK